MFKKRAFLASECFVYKNMSSSFLDGPILMDIKAKFGEIVCKEFNQCKTFKLINLVKYEIFMFD